MFLCVYLACMLGSAPCGYAQSSTEDHVSGPGFWPTKSAESVSAFAGKEACARCHGGMAVTAQASSMGRTAMHADTADVLHQHQDLRFSFGRDLYRITTTKEAARWQSVYAVSDGTRTVALPVLWIFGTGRVGQSYLVKTGEGHFLEARTTFFQSQKTLGFTPARALEQPADLEIAQGREVQTPELIRCFSCHATAVNIAERFNEEGLTPGVTCEACHGPSANHVRLMGGSSAASAATEELGVYDPSHLSPTESVEFCGACHGTWWDVKLAHVTGPSTVRSAPYRLVTSKCWGKEGDPRLVCTACHDPHRELVTDIATYDAACLRCHAGSAKATSGTALADGHGAQAPGCPVATTKCASCHMPQVYVPEMQNTFTDHRIRIAKAGEAFQD